MSSGGRTTRQINALTVAISGVARIWCEEGHELRENNLTLTHKNITEFMQ